MADTSTPRARGKHDKNASKQKNKQSDWYECICCRRVVHSRDTTQHEEACKTGQKLEHGYIVDGKLHAIIAPTSIVPDDKRVPASRQNDVAYIHPSTMALCQLACGLPCVVNHSHVLWVWPCDRVPPVSVVLPAVSMTIMEDVEEGKHVTVEHFTPAGPACAARVTAELRPAKKLFYKSDFAELLPFLMEGKYISEGNIHHVSYCGHSCAFTIRTVQQQQLQASEDSTESFPTDDISNKDPVSSLDLSSLNISGVSDSGDHGNTSITSACVSPDTPGSSSFQNVSVSSVPDIPDSGKEKPSRQFCTPLMTHSKRVSDVSLNKFALVTAETKFFIAKCGKENDNSVNEDQKLKFDSIGGLEKQIQMIQELSRPILQTSQQTKGCQSCGILLYGPSGTGKTLLAQAMANEFPVLTVQVPVHSIWSKIYGETERKLCALFESALERSPSLIVLDNLEAMCPRAGTYQTDLEKRVVNTVISLIDGVLTKGTKRRCIVLGITNDPSNIDPALRRPGRLDNEIQTDVPSPDERLQIVKALIQNKPHNLTDQELKIICDETHGFVGADLYGLVKEACIHAIRRSVNQSQPEKPVLTSQDLRAALRRVSPSVMKEMQLEVPQVRWSDIGGQTEVKEKLKQAVEWPLKHPEAFSRLGIPPPRGLLMYGPPGCSKTMVAKALATESGLNFLAVKGSELFSKWVGESEQAVRTVFQKARAAAPSIIFFDEIDALAVERGRSSGSSSVADRVLTQLLTEMDGVEGLQRVYVVAATNRPDIIDKALLRPGRFDNILYVPLPDAVTRREILLIELRKKPVAADVSLDKLVNMTEGYSGAELTALCNEAALCALEEDVNAGEISMQHFTTAMAEIVPATNKSMVQLYENFSQQPDLKVV